MPRLPRWDQILRPVWRLLACPFGWHKVDMRFDDDPSGGRFLPVCRYCSYSWPPPVRDAGETPRRSRDSGRG